MTTKILTVREPWASLIIQGRKRIENRTWAPRNLGRIGIHAAQQIDRAGAAVYGDPGERTRGLVLGTVEVHSHHVEGSPACERAGCRDDEFAQFTPWRDRASQRALVIHWLVRNPRPFRTPFAARGALGLWTPGPRVAHLVENGGDPT